MKTFSFHKTLIHFIILTSCKLKNNVNISLQKNVLLRMDRDDKIIRKIRKIRAVEKTPNSRLKG